MQKDGRKGRKIVWKRTKEVPDQVKDNNNKKPLKHAAKRHKKMRQLNQTTTAIPKTKRKESAKEET